MQQRMSSDSELKLKEEELEKAYKEINRRDEYLKKMVKKMEHVSVWTAPAFGVAWDMLKLLCYVQLNLIETNTLDMNVCATRTIFLVFISM